MTIMQFSSSQTNGRYQDTLYDLSMMSSDNKRIEIPPEYCQFKELPFETGSALYAPVCTIDIQQPICNEYRKESLKEVSWMLQVDSQECLSWSKYHCITNESSESYIPGKNALMPLFKRKGKYTYSPISLHELNKRNNKFSQSKSDSC